MKRILVFLLAATMILGMVAICSSANDLNEPVEYRDEEGNIIGEEQGGLVPKIVDYDVKVDGQMEGFYKDGLKVNISRLDGNLEKPVSGTAYIVYDDNNLYVYVECNDAEYFNIMEYITICPDCGKQRGQDSGCEHMAEGEHDVGPDGTTAVNMWDDDCIEFMVDWANAGSANTPSQYRISRSGTMSRDWDTFNTGFSGKGYNSGATWGAEYSIPLESSAMGTQIGISIMIHSMNSLVPYDETWAMDNNFNATGGPWDSDYFDYIILDAAFETLNTEIESEKPTVGPGVQQTETVITTNEAGETVVVPTKPTNPTTADPIVYIVLVAIVSLGAAVVVKKTCFDK